MYGQLPPLGVADWSVLNITATTFDYQRVPAIPAGAASLGRLVTRNNDGSIVSQNQGGGGVTQTVSGLTTATAYTIRVAWFNAGVQVSDWSDRKTVTTI